MEKIINIAVVAHVDAGKSTLVDALLEQNGVFSSHEEIQERVMDSNDLEKERGITIYSKTVQSDIKIIKSISWILQDMQTFQVKLNVL